MDRVELLAFIIFQLAAIIGIVANMRSNRIKATGDFSQQATDQIITLFKELNLKQYTIGELQAQLTDYRSSNYVLTHELTRLKADHEREKKTYLLALKRKDLIIIDMDNKLKGCNDE